MLALLGIAGSPSALTVIVTMLSLLAVNSLFYVLLMHCMYGLVLRQMGYECSAMPRLVQRLLYRQQAVMPT